MTGVQTCALPISGPVLVPPPGVSGPVGPSNPIHRTCQTRFPLFSITSRSERPKLPGCRAIPECRSGLMHHPPARSTACPGATQRECTTSLRHKSLRDYRKPQKKNVLTLYEKFARISQFASPTAARCNPAGTPPVLRPALGCTGCARNLFDWRPLRRQFPHFHVARPSGALPPRRESG